MDSITSNPLFDLAPVAYSIIDLDLKQIAANQKFTELFGDFAEERPSAVGLTHPDDLDKSISYLHRVMNGSIEGPLEKRYIRADGSIFWGRLTARKIRLDGTPVLVGVIEDVQQAHDLLEHLAASILEAHEQADLRARFVSQVSHELRNPLHLIAGTSELINNASIPMKQRQQAASIHREALSLAGLVDDLLDIGRVDAGELALKRAPFSTRSLIHRIHQTMVTQANAKGLQFDVSVDDAVPVHVIGDEGRLRQILVNLTSNGVKFTPRGSVTLTVDVDDAGLVRCRVVDSGPGVPEDGMATIFEPFVRLSRVESGAGLGLAISSRLASLLGGTLTVANLQPSGAVFELRIPLDETTERAEEPAVPSSTSAGPPLHVLIVEDNVENQLLASAQLEALGFTCDIANDGYEALDRIDHTTFDAILMDWHLPGIDGLQTTRRIRARELQRGEARRPIIALTARTMAADVEACFNAGVDDHISKPAGLRTLRQALLRWTNDLPEHQHTVEDESSVMNRSALMDLFDNLGDVDLVSSIVATYLEELDGRVERILIGEDARAIESAAHVLASTSSIVGASGLHDVARAVEDSIRADEDVTDSLIQDLVKMAEFTATTLSEEFDSLKAGT